MSESRLKNLRGIRQSQESLDDLEEAADSLDWRCIVLDGAAVVDKASFLEACSESFGLPEWFGMNWDALEECLAELELGVDGLVVLWSEWGEFAEEAPQDFATAVDVLRGAVKTWAADGVLGGVVLVGEGAKVDIDQL